MAGSVTGGVETARTRVLSLDELQAVWRWAAADGGRYAEIVMLLVLTGCRREEFAAATWAELDLEDGVWRLPNERVKNGVGRDVMLA